MKTLIRFCALWVRRFIYFKHFIHLVSTHVYYLVGCLSMIVWTHAVLGVSYTCALYLCICTCSAQLSMFHAERRSRNTNPTIIIMYTSEMEMEESSKQNKTKLKVEVQRPQKAPSGVQGQLPGMGVSGRRPLKLKAFSKSKVWEIPFPGTLSCFK